MQEIKFRAWNRKTSKWATHNELLAEIPVSATIRPPEILKEAD